MQLTAPVKNFQESQHQPQTSLTYTIEISQKVINKTTTALYTVSQRNPQYPLPDPEYPPRIHSRQID